MEYVYSLAAIAGVVILAVLKEIAYDRIDQHFENQKNSQKGNEHGNTD